MAALTASRFISTSSHAKYGITFESEPRTFQNMRMLYLRNETTGYHGLRAQNTLELVQMRRNVKASSRQGRRGSRDGSRRPLAVISCGSGMRIVLVATEVSPWSKTGGLGDVLGGPPPAMAFRIFSLLWIIRNNRVFVIYVELNYLLLSVIYFVQENGHIVMVVVSRHDQYKDAWDTSVLDGIKMGIELSLHASSTAIKEELIVCLLITPCFLKRFGGKLVEKYDGPVTGTDYQDNQLRFSLLCLAALEAPRILNLTNEHFSGPYGNWKEDGEAARAIRRAISNEGQRSRKIQCAVGPHDDSWS